MWQSIQFVHYGDVIMSRFLREAMGGLVAVAMLGLLGATLYIANQLLVSIGL